MWSDCRHPRFRNFNSTVPVDVVREKSYVNSLCNSTRVPVRVSVNNLTSSQSGNARYYWSVQKGLNFEFVKAFCPYRAP